MRSPVLSSCLILLSLVAALALVRPVQSGPPDLSAYPWLYLRGGEPLRPEENGAELIAVGDVMLGRGVASQPDPLGDVAPWLRQAGLALGNLECVISSDSQPRWISNRSPASARSADPFSAGGFTASQTASAESGFLLQAAPSAVAQLRDAGFDLLGLANNHTLELGPEGLEETASRLQAAGMAAVGAGPDLDAAFQPMLRDMAGVRVAFLAFNAVPGARGSQRGDGWARAEWDPDRACAAVAAAQECSDAVVVSIHWGYEYQVSVDPAQRDAAVALLDAGADLVIGHHPHVVQAFETHGDGCVAYSLGNLVFDQGQGETGQGLALRAIFDHQGLRAVQALPVMAGPRPRLMKTEEAASLLARIQPPPPRLTIACDGGVCRRVDAASEATPDAKTGLFWGGRIDLTGDGIPEHVRRMGEQVVVFSDGVEVWRSPPDWHVVDAALGDPNADGRGEVLLALWKTGLDGLEKPDPEKELVPRSHPFIVGYRGGAYRTLWGGSAVSNPIHEVELGDVDGDSSQELIVLEGDSADDRRVSVWRWHGWGFSLIWRSQPGAYRDVVLVDNRLISVVVE